MLSQDSIVFFLGETGNKAVQPSHHKSTEEPRGIFYHFHSGVRKGKRREGGSTNKQTVDTARWMWRWHFRHGTDGSSSGQKGALPICLLHFLHSCFLILLSTFLLVSLQKWLASLAFFPHLPSLRFPFPSHTIFFKCQWNPCHKALLFCLLGV